jgi:acetyl-CoA carboxylase biotin carboxyl carrier protein
MAGGRRRRRKPGAFSVSGRIDSGKEGAVALSYKDIAEIIKVIDSSNLDELIIELPEIKLVVRRRGAGPASMNPITTAMPSSSPAPVPAPTPVSPPPAPRPMRTDGMIEVRSPMVGTFYRAPSPKDPPFVEVGSLIKPGQPLCLIEVMKLYTTIEAKQAGRVVEILAANGALVEYDQVLFVIEPA